MSRVLGRVVSLPLYNFNKGLSVLFFLLNTLPTSITINLPYSWKADNLMQTKNKHLYTSLTECWHTQWMQLLQKALEISTRKPLFNLEWMILLENQIWEISCLGGGFNPCDCQQYKKWLLSIVQRSAWPDNRCEINEAWTLIHKCVPLVVLISLFAQGGCFNFFSSQIYIYFRCKEQQSLHQGFIFSSKQR